MTNFTRLSLLFFNVVALCACSDYEVKLNDRAIYTPTPLFKGYSITDEALKGCVEQTIEDRKVTKAEELTTLICTNAGITTLAGLETFTALEQLNLAANDIASLSALKHLRELEILDVSDNQLQDVTPLMTLMNLKQLYLDGNETLNCNQLIQLQTNTGAQLVSPAHCQ